MNSPPRMVPTFCHSPRLRMVAQPSDQYRLCPMAYLYDVVASCSVGEAVQASKYAVSIDGFFAPGQNTCTTTYLDRSCTIILLALYHIRCTFSCSFGSCCGFLRCVFASHVLWSEQALSFELGSRLGVCGCVAHVTQVRFTKD